MVENDIMFRWEQTQIDGYNGYWVWKKIIECDDPAHIVMTQVLYVNLKFIDEPLGFI
jgi:hypothetical protein